MARPPRMTVKLSHERKVRSLAKKTLGSTRVGRAMRLPVEKSVVVQTTSREQRKSVYTWSSLEKRLGGHDAVDPAGIASRAGEWMF